jgi:hypothetical protein
VWLFLRMDEVLPGEGAAGSVLNIYSRHSVLRTTYVRWVDGSTGGGVNMTLTRLNWGSAAAPKLGGRRRICLS